LNEYWQSYNNPAINFVERYRSGVPNSVIIYNTPIRGTDRLKADMGVYLQDTWTMKKLTLTPGVGSTTGRPGTTSRACRSSRSG